VAESTLSPLITKVLIRRITGGKDRTGEGGREGGWAALLIELQATIQPPRP
jgi:hypothetical protein